jgi:hypothetical protein
MQNDEIVRNVEGRPELAGSERFGDVPAGLGFQHIAGGQAFHGYMLLMQIAVEGRLAGDFRRHIENILRRGDDHGAVGFSYADVDNLDGLKRVLIGKGQDAITLHAGVRLNAQAE